MRRAGRRRRQPLGGGEPSEARLVCAGVAARQRHMEDPRRRFGCAIGPGVQLVRQGGK